MSTDIAAAVITALSGVSATVTRGLSVNQTASRPAVYVSKIAEQSAPSSAANLVVQQVSVTIQVLISADASTIESLRDSIMSAILGLVPGSDCDALEFGGGSAIDSGAAAIWWRDTYTLNQYRRQA